jgi:hypothetical protein
VLYRKDKTLVEILDRLQRLEGKIDQFPTQGPAPTGFGPAQTAPTSHPSFSPDVDEPGSSSSPRLDQQSSSSDIGSGQPYRHASAAHKMLAWPVIQQLLFQTPPSNIADLKSLEQEGPGFIVRTQDGTPSLPQDESLQDRPFVAMQSRASRASGGERTTFPRLTRDMMG